MSKGCVGGAAGVVVCDNTTMTRRGLAVGVLVLAGLALGGCASKPTLRVHHAELRSATIQGVGLDVMIQVDNPNSYDLQIRNVRASVLIAGRYMLPPLLFSPNQWLPAGEKTLVRVPMLIPYDLVPRLINESVNTPLIVYAVSGSADVTAVRLLGIEKDNYPINEQSSISRMGLIAAAGRSISF